MLERIRWFFERGIHDGMSSEERRLLLFHRFNIVALLWISPLFGIWSYSRGSTFDAVLQLLSGLVYLYALRLTLRGMHLQSKVLYNFGATAVLFSFWLIVPSHMLYPWWLLTMLYAGAVFRGNERIWKVTSMSLSGGLFAFGAWFDFQYHGELPIGDYTRPNIVGLGELLARMHLVSQVALCVAIATVVGFMSEQMRTAEAHLVDEHEKSEGLLLNILPRPIAERLKRNPQVIADGFPHVTVLFSDIVGFTPMSDKLSPEDLVELLNRLFTGFDRIAQRHGLEKIKTIGDAYMVAAGVPVPTIRHAHAVAEMALDMRAFALEFGAQLDPPVSIRIGVHSGPVVAGVIGESKFAYDLWGDTVNTASRMESSGVPGEIQVSAVTHALLADDYVFRDRGTISVKGKGEMKAYFLDGRVEPAVEPG